MGSGKSYMGKALADALGWDFLDADTFLEHNEKRSISQIFAEDGEAHFRQLEQFYLKITQDFHQTIIGTGGGAPCFFDNIQWMNQHGQTIYLKTPTPILVNRLKTETANRPLLTGKSDQELVAFIDQKLADRSRFYEQAQIIFEYRTGLENAKDLLDLLKSSNDK